MVNGATNQYMDAQLKNRNTDMKNKYHIRIRYKSGQHHDFWCSSFKITVGATGNRSYAWTECDKSNQAIMIGADDIESVWQIGYRENFVNTIKRLFRQ